MHVHRMRSSTVAFTTIPQCPGTDVPSKDTRRRPSKLRPRAPRLRMPGCGLGHRGTPGNHNENGGDKNKQSIFLTVEMMCI